MRERSYKTAKNVLDRVFAKFIVYIKIIAIFAVLAIHFVFSENHINATGFDESYSLRGGLLTVNDGGIFLKIMVDKKEIKREFQICVFCNKEYYPHSYRSICCSIECIWKERNRRNNKTKQVSKKCKYCNGLFINSHKTRVYCSVKCREKWWVNKRMIQEQRKCTHCLLIFTASNNHRKYCSIDCYKEYWKEHSYQFVINKERQRTYQKWYVKSTPLRKLRYQLSDRIRKHLRAKGFKKDTELKKILGCSVLELIKHLESKFKEGMNWGNHSTKGWHIDHKIPLCTARNKKEIYKLWHYSNLQPLWAIDNLKKGGKII